jgi:hypothetical protein
MLYDRKCACCGNALSPELSSHDICGVCKWEDDPSQNNDPDYDGGANYISLNQAKQALAAGQSVRALEKAVKQRLKEEEAAREAAEAALLDNEGEAVVAAGELALV